MMKTRRQIQHLESQLRRTSCVESKEALAARLRSLDKRMQCLKHLYRMHKLATVIFGMVDGDE
jgi:predicted ferric reductase